MAINSYKFLSDSDTSPKGIWAWAKKLVQDLNKRDAELGAVSAGVPVGSAMVWTEEVAPVGWLLADGGSYAVADKAALFNVYGYRYGGAGDVFNVPNWRNRLLMGAGDIVQLNRTEGAEEVTISTDNMPAHTHGLTDPGHSHAVENDPHTHTFTGTAHTHAVTDPGHVHAITDPTHNHASIEGPSGAPTEAQAGVGGGYAWEYPAATGSSATGITIDSHTTGVTNQNTAAGGTNSDETVTGAAASSTTGASVASAGGGTALSVLNPVFGVNVIIKY